MRIIATALLVAATSFSVSAYALTTGDAVGHNANGAAPQRTISIDGNTRYVNVRRGDIVKLANGEKSVTWQFDGVNSSFPLSEVFPAVANAGDIKVYVEIEEFH